MKSKDYDFSPAIIVNINIYKLNFSIRLNSRYMIHFYSISNKKPNKHHNNYNRN